MDGDKHMLAADHSVLGHLAIQGGILHFEGMCPEIKAPGPRRTHTHDKHCTKNCSLLVPCWDTCNERERLQLRKHQQPPTSQCSHVAGAGTTIERHRIFYCPNWSEICASSPLAAASLLLLCTPLPGRGEGMQVCAGM